MWCCVCEYYVCIHTHARAHTHIHMQDLVEELRQSSEVLEKERAQHAAACERERSLQEALASLQDSDSSTKVDRICSL